RYDITYNPFQHESRRSMCLNHGPSTDCAEGNVRPCRARIPREKQLPSLGAFDPFESGRCFLGAWVVRSVRSFQDAQSPLRVTECPVQVPFGLENRPYVVGVRGDRGMVRSIDFLIDVQRTLRVTERAVQVPFSL